MSGTLVVNVPIMARDMPVGQARQEEIKKKILNAARIQWGMDAVVELRAQFRRIPGFQGAAIAEFTMWKVEDE